MTTVDLPKFPTRHGYMSEKIQHVYITGNQEGPAAVRCTQDA